MQWMHACEKTEANIDRVPKEVDQLSTGRGTSINCRVMITLEVDENKRQ